nr:MAG TPA: hypothetical protein [Bacteriophage sp.]
MPRTKPGQRYTILQGAIQYNPKQVILYHEKHLTV